MFVETLSLGRLSDKTEELHLPMRHGYFPLDVNPVFICHIIIIIIVIIITIIIISTIIIIIITIKKIALLLTSFISGKIPKISQHIKVASLQEHKRN